MNLRRVNRAIHRDLGYFFFGMCIIYGISGVALNHRHQWNANYIVSQQDFTLNISDNHFTGKEMADKVLQQMPVQGRYKTHLENPPYMRIFIEGGTVNYNMQTGKGMVETIKRRPVFNQMNFLHYNTPRKLWTWFSDVFAVGLILLAVSGLFILKGKNGFNRRGVYFVVTGILIPLGFLYLYLGI